MARTKLRWIIQSDDGVNMREPRPTRKSIDRKAQELANAFGQPMWYYTNRARAKWSRTGKSIKMYKVEPNNDC